MKKFLIGLLAIALMSSCGALVDIDYHWDVDPDWIEAKVGYPTYGYYYRTLFSCDIYMAPMDFVGSDECFDAVLQHEERHCDEGAYHPHTPEGSREEACES